MSYLLVLLAQILQQSVELVFIDVAIAVLREEKQSRSRTPRQCGHTHEGHALAPSQAAPDPLSDPHGWLLRGSRVTSHSTPYIGHTL